MHLYETSKDCIISYPQSLLYDELCLNLVLFGEEVIGYEEWVELSILHHSDVVGNPTIFKDLLCIFKPTHEYNLLGVLLHLRTQWREIQYHMLMRHPL